MNRYGIRPGSLTPAILEQGEVWIDRHGIEHRLTEMDRDWLCNLRGFLLRHGEQLRWAWSSHQTAMHFATGREVIGEVDGMPVHGRAVLLFSDGGNLDAAFDEWLDREMDRPLEDWLGDRPLLKAIEAVLA